MFYYYGMRLRGRAPGCQPNGWVLSCDDVKYNRYYSIIVYDRKLTEKEMKDYELDYLGTDYRRRGN